MRNLLRLPPGVLIALAVLVAAAAAAPLLGQTTTAQLQGVVRDDGGPIPGGLVTAVNTESGLTRVVSAGPDGVYTLVLPPGPYDVSTGTPAHQQMKASLRLMVGQTVEHDFLLKPGTTVTAEVSVSAEVLPEPTTEVATNVARQEIERLPQATRNFINFAALAPGVNVSHDELNQNYTYGAQGSANTNIFIDGTSYKNDITPGGAIGQDADRGNPFPQNAVQEFRVLTQNYKAEYQKASSAIISAITKSGTNEDHGEVFALYQNKELAALDAVTARNTTDKPKYTRWQPGLSIGGPIVKDKLHFFASYEGNYQDRESLVVLGTSGNWPASFVSQFDRYAGVHPAKFQASLFFGKVSANLAEGSTLDVSGDLRHETDVRGFGAANGQPQSSYEQAENLKTDTGTVRGKHTAVLGKFLNEATLGYQSFKWNPVQLGIDQPGRNYEGLLLVGGRPTSQDIQQKRYAVRDDLTLMNLRLFGGDHVVKGGVTFDYLDYHVVKYQDANPTYNYRSSTFVTTPGDMPFNVTIGAGNPDLSRNNKEVGLYLQDDWRISSRLTANLGLRWDYETDMLNNNYVTPAGIRAGFSSVYASNYFTDGTNRPAYYGSVQPRIGFSADVFGTGRTVLFGGWGRYADRTLFNDILDEQFRLQWQKRTIYFSPDGSPMDGRPAVKWDPAYGTVAGLQNLISSGLTDPPEIFLLDNNTKPPESAQWSLGVRHAIGEFAASLAYTGVRSWHQITWTCGMKAADGTCDWGARPAAGYGFSMLSRSKDSWYQAAQLDVEKRFTADSRWSARLTYVYANAEQTGNDLFSFQLLDPAYGTKQRSPQVQRHTIVLSALANLPLGFQGSTLITLGSGYPFNITDCSRGWANCVDRVGGGDPPKWTQSVDLRLEKRFLLAGSYDLGVIAQAVNVFNYTNESGYDGWIPALPEVNAHYGVAGSAYNPRRVEFGLSLRY